MTNKQAITPEALRSRVGRMDQVAGIQLMQLDDGKARGCRVARIFTGSGLDFMVNLDRGMDITAASFCGAAMGWRSTNGDVAPQYYEAEGIRWLRSFPGGLLATCGLQNVGPPPSNSADTGVGLHGRISNTPAENIQCTQAWEGDDYVLRLQGTMRETSVFGANLMLQRTVSTKMGSEEITVQDRLVNEGCSKAHFMLLYHCNIGWPAVDAGSRILAPSKAVESRTDVAKEGAADWYKLDAPTPGYAEKVYFHQMQPDAEGWVRVAVVNQDGAAGNGFGVSVAYKADTLPHFVQWKQMGAQDYVLGLEPSTCKVAGIEEDEKSGNLEYLEPGEAREFNLVFSPVHTQAQYDALAKNSTSESAQVD